jgi:cell division septum initiation protein DivIVA
MARLAADAQSEATQKSFCDSAMSENIGARDTAQAAIETLTAEKSKLTVERSTLEQEIAELSKSVADSKKALMEASALREEESADNSQTISTAEKGKAGVEMALQVLQDFYSGAALAALQIKYVPPNSDRSGKTVGDLAPETFGEEYHGDQTASKGIIGLLEVILSDFERTISTVTEQEQTAQGAFEKLKEETELDISTKEASIVTKQNRVTEIGDLLVDNADKLATESVLLKTAEGELEVLHAQCVAGEESYTDRVAKREKEIESLKQAQAILEDWQG